MLWSTDYLNRLVREAEIEIAKETKSIIVRESIRVSSGVYAYQLPERVNNIRKILYKGARLDPLDSREFYAWVSRLTTYTDPAFLPSAFSDAFHIGARIMGVPEGKPLNYFYNSFGENVVYFNPGINEDVAGFEDGLWDINIGNAVTVEYYGLPDGILVQVPHYIRRRIIKAYVLYKAFAKEGDGQNLNASKHFLGRYTILMERAKFIINNISKASIRTRDEYMDKLAIEEFYRKRGPLPSNYGIVVGDEDLY